MAIVTTPLGVAAGVGVGVGVAVGVGVGVGVVSITKSGLGLGRTAVTDCSFGDATTVMAPAISTTIMTRKRMVVRIRMGDSRERSPELQSGDCIGLSSAGRYWDRRSAPPFLPIYHRG